MPTDPQARATQELVNEYKKLNRTLEMLNNNLVTFIKAYTSDEPPVGLQTSKPTNPIPHYITPPGGDPYGTQR